MINILGFGIYMDITHPIPWFPAWRIVFSTEINELDSVIQLFNKHRPNERWLILGEDVAASEVHLWTTWYSLRRREESNNMAARTPDVEFLRLISGTHQIKTGFKRAGLRLGDKTAWILNLPNEGILESFGKINLNRESYLKNDKLARSLIELLGCKVLPSRPIPKITGLMKIGIENVNENTSLSKIEEIFLTRMALCDL